MIDSSKQNSRNRVLYLHIYRFFTGVITLIYSDDFIRLYVDLYIYMLLPEPAEVKSFCQILRTIGSLNRVNHVIACYSHVYSSKLITVTS